MELFCPRQDAGWCPGGRRAEQQHGTVHGSSGSQLWLWLAPALDTSPGDGVAMAPVLSHPYGDEVGGRREECSRGWLASANHRLLDPAWCYTAPPLPARCLGLQQQDFVRKGNYLHGGGLYRASQPYSSIAGGRGGATLEIPVSKISLASFSQPLALAGEHQHVPASRT